MQKNRKYRYFALIMSLVMVSTLFLPFLALSAGDFYSDEDENDRVLQFILDYVDSFEGEIEIGHVITVPFFDDDSVVEYIKNYVNGVGSENIEVGHVVSVSILNVREISFDSRFDMLVAAGFTVDEAMLEPFDITHNTLCPGGLVHYEYLGFEEDFKYSHTGLYNGQLADFWYCYSHRNKYRDRCAGCGSSYSYTVLGSGCGKVMTIQ